MKFIIKKNYQFNFINSVVFTALFASFSQHLWADEISINNQTGKNFLTARIRPHSSKQWHNLGPITPGNNVFNIPEQAESYGLIEIQNQNQQWQVTNYFPNPNNKNISILTLTKPSKENPTDQKYNQQHHINNADSFMVNDVATSHFVASNLLDNTWSATCYGGGLFGYIHIQCNIEADGGTLYLYGNAFGDGAFGSSGTFTSPYTSAELISAGSVTMTASASPAGQYSPGSAYINTYGSAEGSFSGTGGGAMACVGSAYYGK